MILKELRISRHLSQEQLAQISGLNVRTIQRIESRANASLESLKCLAAALVGGLLMLATAYLYHCLKWQGDKYGIWYDHEPPKSS